MNSPPLVSVVVPVHNAAPYVAETIESLLAQTYPATEILVLDDGSTDETSTRLESYRDRVRLFRHANRGEAATVLRGVDEARGDYLAIVNADDPVAPDLLARSVQVLQTDPTLGAVYPDWRRIDRNGATLDVVQTHEFSLPLMLNAHLCIPGPGAVVRRAALAGEPIRDAEDGASADFGFWLRFGLANRVARLPEVLATWRFHAGGASHAQARRPLADAKRRVIESFFARADLPPDIRALQRQALSAAYFKAAMVGMRGRGIPVRRYLWRSFALKPTWPSGMPASERRAPLHILYLIGLPLTRWVLGLLAPLLPANERRKAQALLDPT